MQASTNFPKVRRMLLFLASLSCIHFWPASTLLRGHLALATLSHPETDPQILERWGCADEVHLGKYPSEGLWSRILVWRAIAFVKFSSWIGFSMSELSRKIDFGAQWSTSSTSSFQLMIGVTIDIKSTRSLVIFVTFDNKLPYIVVPIILLQHGYCTFVIILWRPFTKLFINLMMWIRALFSQICNHSWSCRTIILEGATFHRMSWCKFPWSNPCNAIKTFYHWDFFLWDFGFSTHLPHSAAWKNSETDSTVIFHAYSYRGGNCNCLLQNTARWTPILCTRFFVPGFLTMAFFSKLPFLTPKFLFLTSCSILLFTIVFNLW